MVSQDKELRARCDAKHIQALREIAKVEGIRQAEALRLVVREKARSLGVWPGQPARRQKAA